MDIRIPDDNLTDAEKLPLSLVVITKNAGNHLEKCLRSVPFAQEIVVVDSGSTDNTLEIAERWQARVFHQPFLGFGQQKNFAVQQAQNHWVLCLDADEYLSVELAASMQKELKNPQYGAYRFTRCNRFLGRWLRHGEGYPDWTTRLFDRNTARWSQDTVHEKIQAAGIIHSLHGDLLHESAESLSHYIDKQNRYSSLLAEELFQRGIWPSWYKIFGSPLVRFFRFYCLRLGFLDGKAGLIHIAIGCFASMMKYAKLLALHQNTKTSYQSLTPLNPIKINENPEELFAKPIERTSHPSQ